MAQDDPFFSALDEVRGSAGQADADPFLAALDDVRSTPASRGREFQAATERLAAGGPVRPSEVGPGNYRPFSSAAIQPKTSHQTSEIRARRQASLDGRVSIEPMPSHAVPTPPGPSLIDRAIPTAMRVGGAVAGGVLGSPLDLFVGPAGTLAGSAIGSGVGEYAAEQYETMRGQRQAINPTQVALQTGLGAIPLGRAPGAGATVEELLRYAGTVAPRRAAQGAAFGAGAATATHYVDTGELPSPSDLVAPSAFGAVFGGLGGRYLERPALQGRAARQAEQEALEAVTRFLNQRALPPGPSFVAPERGPAGRPGQVIDVTPSPRVPRAEDSYVRAVPGDYARRAARGALPSGPRFIADAAGHVAPMEQAGDAFGQALADVRREAATVPPAGPDPSGVRSVPAVPVAYTFEQARGAKGRASQRLVPSQYSGDVNAVPAPHVPPITPDLDHALRWIETDYAEHAPTRRGFIEAGAGRGGDLEVVPGAAGTNIHDYITGQRYDRGAVLKAIQNLRAGKLTPLGADVLEVARELAAGNRSAVSRMTLPPEAAGDLTGTVWASRRAAAGEGAPGALRVRPLSSLSPEQAAVQERVASALEQHPERYVQAYRERFGNLVSADAAKAIVSPEYATSAAYRTANDLAVHRPGSALAHAVYERLLEEPTPAGKDPLVVFTAGGTGAGKTSGLREVYPALADNAKIVVDSTLSDLEGATRDIERAVETGHQVGIIYTDRDIEDAFRATLERAGREGRPVTINTHVRTHLRAPDVLRALEQRFAGDPNVDFLAVRNTPAGREPVPIETIQPKGYNEGDVQARLGQILDAESAAGRVSPELRAAVRPQTSGVPEGAADYRGGLREGPSAASTGEAGRPLGSSPPSTTSETGAIRPELMVRLGTGAAGAGAGYATGDDRKDRLERALIGGLAGFAAPSMLPSRGGGATHPAQTLESGARMVVSGRRGTAGTLRTVPTTPIPQAEPIPRARLLEFPSLQKQPAEVRDGIAAILEQHGGFTAQRRHVQSVERTQALADRLEVPLRELRPGTALNAEELEAYKNAVASVMTQRQPLLEKIQRGTANDVEKLQFAKLTDEATVLIANFRGAKAEAGRALNILRAKARVLEYGDSSLIEAAIKAPGFDGNIKQLAAEVAAAAGDPLKQLQILQRTASGTFYQKAQAAYYNSLLSGVKTHLRNAIGNSANAVANLLTPIGAAPIDVARAALTGTPREVYLRELPEGVVATFTAMPQAFRDFLFTVRNGFTPFTVAQAAAGAFDTPRVEVPGGMLTNWPSRMLEASDTFFRSLARNQELHMGAFAAARRGRASGLTVRMADLLAGTSPEAQALAQRADDFARRAVFQEDPGAAINYLLQIKSNPRVHPAIRTAATFIAPFVRTPSNILRQGMEASPIGFVMPSAHQGGREGVQALGRATLGSLALAPLAYLAATGRLSGNGPTDRGEREALYDKGWQPNSVKIGDSWVRYQLFQPLSVPMAAVGNAYERFHASDRKDKAAEESMLQAVTGAAASLMDQSFLAGLNGLLDAVSDPEKNAQRFLSTFAQGLVPGSGLLRNITQAVDPKIRKPEGIVESVKTITPGLSQTVPARQSRFGEDVTRPGGPIRRGFIVPEVSKEKHDAVADALSELGIHPEVPRGHLVRQGQVVKLTRDQEQVLIKAIGQERRARLERIFQARGFRAMPENAKRQLIETTLSAVTRDVNNQAYTRIRRGAPLSVDVLAAAAAASR